MYWTSLNTDSACCAHGRLLAFHVGPPTAYAKLSNECLLRVPAARRSNVPVKAFAKETSTATITPSSTPVREKAKGMGKTDLQSGVTESVGGASV